MTTLSMQRSPAAAMEPMSRATSFSEPPWRASLKKMEEKLFYWCFSKDYDPLIQVAFDLVLHLQNHSCYKWLKFKIVAL